MQIVTALILIVGFCLNKINIIVKSGWRKKTQENKMTMINEIKHVLKPLEPAYGELSVSDLPLQAARVLLLTEGPYVKAFQDSQGNKNFGYSAV